MLRAILKLSIVGVIIFGGLTLIPDEIKQSATSVVRAVINDFIPETVKDKIEEVILSPTERRTRLLKDLDNNIDSIKKKLSSLTSPEYSNPQNIAPIKEEIKEVEKIIKKLDSANNKQSAVNKVTSKIYSTVTGSKEETSTKTIQNETDLASTCASYCAP